MGKGYFALVLHAHLPFVRHPEHEDFLEENWFFEALTETYIPVVSILEKLIEETIDFRLTMSLTPPLISMMVDPLLQHRYVKHLDKMTELAIKEIERTRWEPEYNKLALLYYNKLKSTKKFFAEKYHCNIINAFKNLQDSGKLEIITCGATHGFLPNLSLNEYAVKAQIDIAVKHYEQYFRETPKGIWLPECGFYPGLDKFIKNVGIKYFFLETHGVLNATPKPKNGVHLPVMTTSNVAVFGRDIESSKQVWSADEGYPGDQNYRDFYKDIGFDLDFDYIKPYIHPDGIRIFTGFKYHKITAKNTKHKLAYDYESAFKTAKKHAKDFLLKRETQMKNIFKTVENYPIIVAPYDAELFGHWWYEGPNFLDSFFRETFYNSTNFELTTPSEYLNKNRSLEVVTPAHSSWGEMGYNEVWLNKDNDWIYRHLHKIADRMVELATDNKNSSGILQRALKQAARELLLAQSSDWAFIMKTGTAVEYAIKRTKDHIARFNKIYEEVMSNDIDESWLANIEEKDNIFPNIDYTIYSKN